MKKRIFLLAALLLSMNSIARVADATDSAQVKAAYVTGTVHMVDGGLMA